MIEKILHTPGGGIRVRIPTALNEITLGTMVALQQQAKPNAVEAISLLSGVPAKYLYSVADPEELAEFDQYVRSLSNQVSYLYNSRMLPQEVELLLGKRKVTVKVLRHLSIEPAGAFLAARDIIAEEINRQINLYGEENWREHFQPSLRSCSHLLAQYFFCRATGKKYDEIEAWQFTEQVEQLRVTDALPIAKHFFSAYPDLLHQHFSWLERLQHYWRRQKIIRRLKNKNFL